MREGASYSQETRKIILSLERIRKVAPNGKEVLNNVSLGEQGTCLILQIKHGAGCVVLGTETALGVMSSGCEQRTSAGCSAKAAQLRAYQALMRLAVHNRG